MAILSCDIIVDIVHSETIPCTWCQLLVLCHHDLIPENIIKGAKGLFFIDWEYASMGHPQFDYQRLLNSQHFMDIPANKCGLQALQAIMIQLWYAIRYPELQEDVKKELIKIIETVNL